MTENWKLPKVSDRKFSFSEVQLLLNCSVDKTMRAYFWGLLEDKSWTFVAEAPLVIWGVGGSKWSPVLFVRVNVTFKVLCILGFQDRVL